MSLKPGSPCTCQPEPEHVFIRPVRCRRSNNFCAVRLNHSSEDNRPSSCQRSAHVRLFRQYQSWCSCPIRYTADAQSRWSGLRLEPRQERRRGPSICLESTFSSCNCTQRLECPATRATRKPSDLEISLLVDAHPVRNSLKPLQTRTRARHRRSSSLECP
jgi:hypothetical protein